MRAAHFACRRCAQTRAERRRRRRRRPAGPRRLFTARLFTPKISRWDRPHPLGNDRVPRVRPRPPPLTPRIVAPTACAQPAAFSEPSSRRARAARPCFWFAPPCRSRRHRGGGGFGGGGREAGSSRRCRALNHWLRDLLVEMGAPTSASCSRGWTPRPYMAGGARRAPLPRHESDGDVSRRGREGLPQAGGRDRDRSELRLLLRDAGRMVTNAWISDADAEAYAAL